MSPSTVAGGQSIYIMKKEIILGIDLGTSNSCVAIYENGEAKVITNSEGSRTTPSIVAFTKNGEKLVGQAAKRQAIANPKNTIFSAKRLIGRKYTEVKDEIKNLPYTVIEGPNGDAWIEVVENNETKKYSPQQIGAFILGKIKADAEAYLGETVKKAVITVPAYFNDTQRQATKDAGAIAGLEVLRIVNEPTAASLAYGLDKKKDEKIAVFDLGGGTFDVTVLELGDGVFEVKATNGDTHLGGDDWDKAIVDYMINEFKRENGIDLSTDKMALQRLKEESEKTKISLSSAYSYDVNLPFITADANGPKHLNITISRTKLEQICESLFNRLLEPYKNCLKDADVKSSDLDELVLVGGMTRMPKVVDHARKFFDKSPNQGVNPDEVVAVGAAIQGGVLSGQVDDILLLDVTPLTLSIETAGGVATPMIPRNTTVPTKKSQVFSTYSDNQPTVDIVVLQGERPMSVDNKKLGDFKLGSIPPAPRGTPQIEVTFDVDANGILHVTAKDLGTGQDQKITIQNSSGLSADEIDRMKKEAEENAERDKEARDKVETKNSLNNLIYQWEKQLSEGSFDQPTADKINSAVKDAKSALDKNDVDEMKQHIKALTDVGQEAYKQKQDNVEPNKPKDSDTVGV
jgi:molecular chaperone DnaK